MAGRIPRNFIDDLIARTDIVDIIDSRVKLKKKGKDYRACCPFHNGNNNSSFSVSAEKQFYHCFNCGAGGNVLSFLMEYDGIEFVDAVESLAEQFSLEIPREQNSNGQFQSVPYIDKKDLYQLMDEITNFYQKQLRTHANSQKVITYLKNRGLSGETVKYFKIGYAPDGWDEVRKKFALNAELEEKLIETGMLISKDKGGSYDRFRDRLMFPILDRRGRSIGFGGRVLGDDVPKYLNSPDTPIFNKGSGTEFYGLFQVKQAYKTIERILIVEGYMDVVALKQFGIDYCVASLGTSTSAKQIDMLFRQTGKITCCYDGDKAGREAAWRALENALPYIQDGRTLSFMFLPDREDPDSIIQKEGKEAFEIRIDQAMPLSDFLFEHFLEQVDMRTSDSKSKLAQLALPLIAKLPTSSFRQMMEERLIRLLGIEKDGLKKLLPATNKSTNSKQNHKTTPMRLAISLLLQKPSIGYQLPEFPEFKEMNLPGLKLLNSLLEKCRNRSNISSGQLIELWRDQPEHKQLQKLLLLQNDIDDNKCEAVFLDVIDNFLKINIKEHIEILKQKSRSGQILTEQETKKLTQLLLEQKDINLS